MKILQSGYMKSGNYWLYRIISEIYKEAGLDHKSHIKGHPIYPLASSWTLSYPEQADIDMIDILYQGVFFRISSRYREKIRDFDKYISETDHVWTHSDFCERSPEVMDKFDNVIYIVRDVRDVLISSAKFAFTDYMQEYWPTHHPDPESYLRNEAGNLSAHWAQHVEKYLEGSKNTPVYFMFYERMRYDLYSEISDLLDYLEIILSESQKESIVRKVSFDTMKSHTPGHVREGNFYGWINNLPSEIKAEVVENSNRILKKLNYPLTDDDLSLPKIPETSYSRLF